MAADSAVTIGVDGGAKIYNTVNKLFGLSKFEPVGTMVWGNADFLGVPWETIIKAFRRKQGKTSYAKLEQYADAFLKFLTNNEVFFPKESQEAAARSILNALLTTLVSRARKDAAEDKRRLRRQSPRCWRRPIARWLHARSYRASPTRTSRGWPYRD